MMPGWFEAEAPPLLSQALFAFGGASMFFLTHRRVLMTVAIAAFVAGIATTWLGLPMFSAAIAFTVCVLTEPAVWKKKAKPRAGPKPIEGLPVDHVDFETRELVSLLIHHAVTHGKLRFRHPDKPDLNIWIEAKIEERRAALLSVLRSRGLRVLLRTARQSGRPARDSVLRSVPRQAERRALERKLSAGHPVTAGCQCWWSLYTGQPFRRGERRMSPLVFSIDGPPKGKERPRLYARHDARL